MIFMKLHNKFTAITAASALALTLASCSLIELSDEDKEKLEEVFPQSDSSLAEDSSAPAEESADDTSDESSAAETAPQTEVTDESVAESEPAQSLDPADSISQANGANGMANESATDSEISLTDDSSMPSEYITIGASITKAYGDIIASGAEICDTDPDSYNLFSHYYIADIDRDGTPELITDIGSCEADRLATVYTYNGEQAVELGNFVSWRSKFGLDDGYMLSETSAIGSYTMYAISIESGALKIEKGETISESKLKNPLAAYAFSDTSGITALE